MTKLLMLVEGQTEEVVVNRLLGPHLEARGVHCIPTLLETRRLASDPSSRGGVSSWEKMRRDLQALLADSSAWVTTLFDYYGLPRDFPGRAKRPPARGAQREVEHLEREMTAAISRSERLIPFLALHELEAWVFAGPAMVAKHFGVPSVERTLAAMVRRAGGPEGINDGPNTHPSRRLSSEIARWKKTSDGPLILEAIGVAAIRKQCPHFHGWVAKLEALGHRG